MSFLPTEKRLYGRRKGRPLHKRKTELVKELLPRLALKIGEGEAERALLAKDPLNLFPFSPQALWFEIGFGGGEHLAEEAFQNPRIGFIGCEPFINGVAGLLDHIDQKNLQNVRILADDARPVLDLLPDYSLERCALLFPDPWPKVRHAERRFINVANLARLERVLIQGGLLRLATDDKQLQDWMRMHVAVCPAFEIIHDSAVAPPGWIPTRYEEKGREAGRTPHYIDARRR